MHDLSWGTAIIGSMIFAAGLGFEELAALVAKRTDSRMVRIFLVWPCTALGYALMTIAALAILGNMLGVFG